MKKRILAILPISIGGRLTTSSIIDGYRQNGCDVTVYDELFDGDIKQALDCDYDQIIGYDFSPIKIKSDYDLKIPCVSYFSDEIRNKTSGPYWQEYEKELYKSDNYTFYWDKELVKQENGRIKNLFYLPHFVNLDVYKDLGKKPKFDIMFAGRLDTDYRLAIFEELVADLSDLKFAWYAHEKHYIDAKMRAKNPKTVEECYQGFIDNEKTMAEAINNAKIVFNMNSQGKSSLNYRTFQAVACKRLHISDYREELSLFGGNMPYYKDLSELTSLIRRYLKDAQLYKNTCEKCYEYLEKTHNSKTAVKYMLEAIER